MFDYNTQNILTYGEDGSFIGSSSKSALMNSGIYITSFFFSGGDMILYASSNSPVQDMLRWDAATDGLTAVSERSREMMPEEVMMGENYIFGDRDNPFIYNNSSTTPSTFWRAAGPCLRCSCAWANTASSTVT